MWFRNILRGSYGEWVSTKSKYSNLKILNLGDSLFGNARTNSISDLLTKISGATFYNGGLGGTRASATETGDFEPFDLPEIIDAIISGDWTAQEAKLGTSVPSYFSDTIALLESIDYSTIDMVTIAYGTNDYTANIPVNNNTKESIIGGIKYAIDQLQANYPLLKILVITPIWRVFDADYDSDNKDYGQGTLKEIASDIVDFCHDYRVPVLYSYRELTFNRTVKTTYYEDNTHLNQNGRKKYAELIEGKISSLY